MQRGRAQLLADARVHRARQVAPLEQIEQRALERADPEGRLDDRSDGRATSGDCDEHVHYEALAATLSTAAATISIWLFDSSGYIGSESTSFAARSDSGNVPAA